MTNISTTEWIASLGWVDTDYVTEVLPVLPNKNYIIAYQQMVVTSISIG